MKDKIQIKCTQLNVLLVKEDGNLLTEKENAENVQMDNGY